MLINPMNTMNFKARIRPTNEIINPDSALGSAIGSGAGTATMTTSANLPTQALSFVIPTGVILSSLPGVRNQPCGLEEGLMAGSTAAAASASLPPQSLTFLIPSGILGGLSYASTVQNNDSNPNSSIQDPSENQREVY